MTYLYTEQIFWWPRVKNFVKVLLGREYRGPQAMEASLQRGLKEAGAPYVLNQIPAGGTMDVACVLAGSKVLQWAIRQKKRGMFSHIVAGPDVGIPDHPNDPVSGDAVERYVLPSRWVGDFVVLLNPKLKTKIRIWSAGVETLSAGLDPSEREGLIIYKKQANPLTYSSVIRILELKGLPYTVVEYGKYKREDYLGLLARSRGMIFFSRSESQGIALNEAWMLGVPTLVCKELKFEHKGRVFDQSSPAPYLTRESGMFFSGIADFDKTLEVFLSRLSSFDPRKYHLENFTDLATANKYLDIIKELNNL